MSDRPIYIDIDGTLTTEPEKPWGQPRSARIDRLRAMIAEGAQIVLWSGGGTAYAQAFAKQYRLDGAIAIGKPECLIDDNPRIRPQLRLLVQAPHIFFGDAG
jgi:hydroxymethylpyrimidine pyrophosphatase-like HAD family hydrolase